MGKVQDLLLGLSVDDCMCMFHFLRLKGCGWYPYYTHQVLWHLALAFIMLSSEELNSLPAYFSDSNNPGVFKT